MPESVTPLIAVGVVTCCSAFCCLFSQAITRSTASNPKLWATTARNRALGDHAGDQKIVCQCAV